MTPDDQAFRRAVRRVARMLQGPHRRRLPQLTASEILAVKISMSTARVARERAIYEAECLRRGVDG